jgi:hypothetical protein
LVAPTRICEDQTGARTTTEKDDDMGRQRKRNPAASRTTFTFDTTCKSISCFPQIVFRLRRLQYKCRQIMTRADFLEGIFN